MVMTGPAVPTRGPEIRNCSGPCNLRDERPIGSNAMGQLMRVDGTFFWCTAGDPTPSVQLLDLLARLGEFLSSLSATAWNDFRVRAIAASEQLPHDR